jgi:membrane-associated phospholipid phosphatase
MHPNNKRSFKQTSNRTDNIIKWLLFVTIGIALILMFSSPLDKILQSYDIQALRDINSNRLRMLDPFFLFITNSSSMVCIAITVITLVAGQIKKSRVLTLKGLQLLITFLTSFIFIRVLKYLFGRKRPYITYNFLDKLAQAESLSFPSGHTFEAFAFATAVALLFKNLWARSFLLLWVILVGLSRMILGMHYLSDVIGGIVLGVITGYAVHVLYQRNIS